MNPLIPLLIAAAVAVPPASAEERLWQSPDGASSFTGTFRSEQDGQVTIERDDGQVFTLSRERLHADDHAWLDERAAAALLPPADAVFDTLAFGDDRQTVQRKLLASKVFQTRVDEDHLGRFGLNGVFQTREPVGGLHCELFFDWSDQGELREITLQSLARPAEDYPLVLKTAWSQFSDLLAKLHGPPVRKTSYPLASSLGNDQFLGSHVWRLEHGGGAMLGTAMQEDQYLVVVRFTREPVKLAAGR